ncbi:MAG TPA: NlpC/P60 family protein [Rhizobiaceae bacterium]|nr:NlpC/P60 family protein [Rhizobiaceae bacterium]
MSAIGETIATAATDWVGTPYRHQGATRGVGCDCLGLVRGVWREVYGHWPQEPGPYAADWAEAGAGDALLEAARRNCVEANELARGRLVLFRWRPHLPAKHAGVLIAPDRFVHAYSGHGVVASALVPQWRRRVAGVFEFPVMSD